MDSSRHRMTQSRIDVIVQFRCGSVDFRIRVLRSCHLHPGRTRYRVCNPVSCFKNPYPAQKIAFFSKYSHYVALPVFFVCQSILIAFR